MKSSCYWEQSFSALVLLLKNQVLRATYLFRHKGPAHPLIIYRNTAFVGPFPAPNSSSREHPTAIYQMVPDPISPLHILTLAVRYCNGSFIFFLGLPWAPGLLQTNTN